MKSTPTGHERTYPGGRSTAGAPRRRRRRNQIRPTEEKHQQRRQSAAPEIREGRGGEDVDCAAEIRRQRQPIRRATTRAGEEETRAATVQSATATAATAGTEVTEVRTGGNRWPKT